MSEANRVLSDAPLITEWPDGEGCTIYTDGGRVDVTWAELAGVLLAAREAVRAGVTA